MELIIHKLEKNYVNVNSREREREREREKERKNNFLRKRTRHKEKKIDKKIWQKDRQQKIVKNIKSRNL